MLRILCSVLLAALFASQGMAHDVGMATLTLDVQEARQALLSVELDVLDVEIAVGLDGDGDGEILWSEYAAQAAPIARYIQKNLVMSVKAQACALDYQSGTGGVRQGVSPSVVTEFALQCAGPISALTVDNQLLADVDPASSALLVVRGSGAEESLVLEHGETTVDVGKSGFIAALWTYTASGVHHILIGADHLVFLLLLLLPAARTGSVKDRLLAVGGIVTCFTLAHSITLTLAATGYLLPPVKAVEIVIAVTVVIAAVINIAKPGHQSSWLIAYSFGLIHGFGFANVLSDMSMSADLRAVNLAAFNVGVELGQLAFVALVFPLLCLLSAKAAYSRLVVTPLSLCMALVGCFWIVQRVG